MSQEKAMTGPSIMATLAAWPDLEKYFLGSSTPTEKTWRPTMMRAASWVMLSSTPQWMGLKMLAPRGPKAMPIRVARGGSERWRVLRIGEEARA